MTLLLIASNTPPADSTITPSIAMSRPSNGVDTPAMWVAPCAVVFDAIGTTDSATADAFRDLFYSWNFGDNTGEFWAYGAKPGTQSKNQEQGPIAGHVYETPGTYTITLTVINAYGGINTVTQEITVTDPNVIFAGQNTICVSTGGDFAGAPSGSLNITSNNFYANMNTYAVAGKRVLFRRGEVFVSGARGTLINRTNFQIGAFGTGVKPEIQITAAISEVIRLWGNNGVIDNVQIFDLNITNPTNIASVYAATLYLPISSDSLYEDLGRVLLYRIEASRTSGYSLSGGRGSALVECSNYHPVTVGGVNGLWASDVYRTMVLGNSLDNNLSGEHCIRFQGWSKAIIAHNYLARPSTAKHCMTIRGSDGPTLTTWTPTTSITIPKYKLPPVSTGFAYKALQAGTTGATEPIWPTSLYATVIDGTTIWRAELVNNGSNPVGYLSVHSNVRDNYFDASNAGNIDWVTTIGTAGDTNYEVNTDIIWDGNYYSYNGSTNTSSHAMLRIQAYRVFVRNNIFDLSEIGSLPASMTAVLVAGSNSVNLPIPSECVIENNTVFSSYANPTNNNSITLVNLSDVGNTGMVVKNNILYAPNNNSSLTVLAKDAAGTAVMSGNSTLSQIKNSNPFAVANPTNVVGYGLSIEGYANATGEAIDGIFVDFHGTTRNRISMDMGAVSKDS